MGANSKISWTHHTFNPWHGCQRVSPGCENCYAEAFNKRVGRADWGPTAPRRFFGDKHWAEPRKWDRAAAEAGERHRVFCASMADVFEDRPDLGPQRTRLWMLIQDTPHLDWLLLTKRTQNVARMLPWPPGHPWPNVWIGTTVEDVRRGQERIAHLLNVSAVVRFLSMEPLLEGVRLHTGTLGCPGHLAETFGNPLIHWVIAGAESGHGRRPMNEDWVRALRDQCTEAGAAFFYKQKVLPSGIKVELPELDGRVWDQVPDPRAAVSAKERTDHG